ncbi:pirin family protein [Robiginitalea sp. SC105]|uniref:pirin family protein n=1 Tax=Robiginitalea sp. SC105 TaxID=2762332 RepID=UPI00163ADB87|nr:pirin family protein [Robiginitalea sp. SC105]MBC2840376.1 pirin family protein [Robiginitalea sp. SC105]
MPETIPVFPLGFPWDTPDPFLFCVHHLDRYPQGNEDLGPDASLAGRPLGNDFTIRDGWRMYHGRTVPGFPAHPHCGFETVTIVTRGYCDHADSLGAAARFGEGDVQWITTGKGLQHSEMFPLLNPQGPNTLELFQIWLNLPARSKRVEPHFKMLWKEDIPIIRKNGASVRLVAGTYGDTTPPAPPPDSWAADPSSELVIAIVDLEPGASFGLPEVDHGTNRRLYLFEGAEIDLGGTRLKNGYGASLDALERKMINGEEPARLLWLQGRPIGEPVAKYGPFVMNTEAEIEQVMQDFRLTQFGGWPWRHPDPVHDRDAGRFARFPDGSEINK